MKRAVEDEDHGAVSLCQQGSLDAFEGLVMKYQKRMLNIAFRMIGSYEDSCEVVQDAFLSAYRNLHSFKGISRFSTWLCAIVINLSKNRMQQMKTVFQHESYSLDDPVETENGHITREVSSEDASILEKLEKEEVRKRVQDCIAALESEFREIIVLRDMQEFSYGEISDILKIPEGTVKSRLFRARNAVRDCLKKVMGEL
jgi:RNA polymerase sigma-70 factor (ECF subfamily)